ncbi:hypothetical protein NCC49_001283 [Naganishia albida]|nr:hypothetical protein NCC49_001283 [Naganishia albida]
MSYPLIQKPIYAYSIPPQLLDILSVRSLAPVDPEPEPEPIERETPRPAPPQAPVPGGAPSCQTCGNVIFGSVDEQRTHFRSDWHRFNVAGNGGVTEEAFEAMDDVSSLSGSASDSDADADASNTDGTSSAEDRVTRLLRRQTLQSAAGAQKDTVDSDQEAEEQEYRRRAELRTAIVWFQARNSPPSSPAVVPDDTQLGIYRALMPRTIAPSQPSTFLAALRAMQLAPAPPPSAPVDFDPFEERKVTLLMVAGGHFAGMVVSLRPLNLAHGKGFKPERQDVKGAGEVRVLRHKTFHRYTTRKKQGGSQSVNDNAKSKANSAGAMLRRYGEQSLKEEIQQLMIEWQDEIRSSEKIFLRASTAGKRSFWGYPGAVLEKGDERVGVFPFPTRRPTLSELIRCWHELTRVKITHLSEDALKALEEAYIASLQPKARPIPAAQPPTPKPVKEAAPKLSPEEESYRERRRRLIDMVKKGRMEPLAPFWAKYGESLGGVNARAEAWVEDVPGQTLLMVASQAGQEDVVKWLLVDQRADPTMTFTNETSAQTSPAEDEDSPATRGGRTAYDFAASKNVRNVFRRLAHDHPDWHDWIGAGHVPSGLSEEKELEQDRKRADRRKGLKEKAKEREAKRAAAEQEALPGSAEVVPEPVTPPAAAAAAKRGPQKLGGGVPGSDTGLAGLTPEMRARIERERRARAAEARLAGRK